MKLNHLYTTYFFLGCLACICLYVDLYTLCIVFRWLGLFLIGLIYFKKAKSKSILFYLGLFFSGLGETFIVLDFLVFFRELCLTLIVYWWILIFLLKKSVRGIEYKINKEHIIPIIVSSVLIVYFTYSILDIVKPKIQDELIYGYVYIASLLLLLFYMGVLYVSKHNERYSWLLFLIIAFVVTNVISSLEGLYYHHQTLEQLGCIVQIITHFLLLKFLIINDDKINYIH